MDLDHVAYRKWLRAEGLDTSLVDPDLSRYANRNLSSLESPLVVGSESGKDPSVFDLLVLVATFQIFMIQKSFSKMPRYCWLLPTPISSSICRNSYVTTAHGATVSHYL